MHKKIEPKSSIKFSMERIGGSVPKHLTELTKETESLKLTEHYAII